MEVFWTAYGVLVCGVDFNVETDGFFCGSIWGGGL